MKKLLASINARIASLWVFFALFSQPLFSQQWQYAGQNGISHTSAFWPALVTDHNGTPWIGYGDYRANVKYYDGTSWVTVGDTSFSNDIADYVSLAFDNTNIPYIAFEDWSQGNKATVMKFNGANWVTVGSAGFSDSAVLFTSIAIDNQGTPYVAYQNHSNSGTIRVKKFNGSTWVNVGTLLPPSYVFSNLALDSAGTPYIAYTDVYNGFGFMKKFDGTNWVSLGPYVVPYVMGYPSIAIDNHGTPYVAFEDDNGGATVFKFNAPNHSWDTLGSAGFNFSNQHNGAQYTSLTITPNDSIYIAFQNGIPSGGSPAKAVAAIFTGNGWSQIGNAELSFSQADYIKIAVDGSGTPFVAFADNFYDRKLSIMKYGTPTVLQLLSDNDLIQVAPNPVQSYLQVTVPKSAEASITLLDINGKAVAKNRTTGTGIETIFVNSLSAGVYLLVYEYSGTKIIKRIIKE